MSKHYAQRGSRALYLSAESRRRAQKNGNRPVANTHKELEVILMRQLADCLTMPIFLVDPEGTLIFYNEPAERLLGQRFDETGEMSLAQWSAAFVPTDYRGRPLPSAKLPLVVALKEQRPAHADFRIRGLDRVARHIQVTAFPLTGRVGRFLGAVAIFWEVPKP
jgi:PAS domain-containing protein